MTTCELAGVTDSLEQPDKPAAARGTTTTAVHRSTRRRSGLTMCPWSVSSSYLAPGDRRWVGPMTRSSTGAGGAELSGRVPPAGLVGHREVVAGGGTRPESSAPPA